MPVEWNTRGTGHYGAWMNHGIEVSADAYQVTASTREMQITTLKKAVALS